MLITARLSISAPGTGRSSRCKKAIDAVLTVPMAFVDSTVGFWPSALPVIKLRYNFILFKYDTSNPNCRQILCLTSRFDTNAVLWYKAKGETQGQFNCVRTRLSGRTNLQNVYNMNPTSVHYEIAEWAMAGGRLANLWEALWFFNPYSSTCPNNFPSSVGYFQIRIGNHCFYNPAPSYANT